MIIRLSAPSKTFLLGEYSVLDGGAALVLGTKPRFVLSATPSGFDRDQEICFGIHPSSPAGRYYTRHKSLHHWNINFEDPHQGLGGFGASSAQFLLLYCLHQMIERGEFVECDSSHGTRPGFLNQDLGVQRLWETFQAHSDAGSGADVLSQLTGGVSYVEMDPIRSTGFEWPFAHYGFMLVRTGRKLATHTHLKSVRTLPADGLKAIFEKGCQAFRNQDAKLFIDAIGSYRETLRELELVAPESNELILALEATDAVAAVKGCGAMGADVLFVMYKKDKEDVVRDRLNLLSLEVAATEADLSSGYKACVEVTAGRALSFRSSSNEALL